MGKSGKDANAKPLSSTPMIEQEHHTGAAGICRVTGLSVMSPAPLSAAWVVQHG